MRVWWSAALLVIFVAAFAGAGPFARLGQDRGDSTADRDLNCDAPARADVSTLERCLAFQPDDVELMLDLGMAHESAGRWVDAERVYRRALRVDPRDGDVRLRLGRVLIARGDLPAARREGEAALAVQPGNPEALRLAEGAASKATP